MYKICKKKRLADTCVRSVLILNWQVKGNATVLGSRKNIVGLFAVLTMTQQREGKEIFGLHKRVSDWRFKGGRSRRKAKSS